MTEAHADGRDEGARPRPREEGSAEAAFPESRPSEPPQTERGASEADSPGPLPRQWLPEPRAVEGHPVWELRVARVMAAAGPALAGPPWWSEMGRWWKVSAGLAAASLLVFLGVPEVPDRPIQGGTGVAGDEFALGMVVAEGDAAAFWGALGVPADPVLAVLTFEAPGTAPPPSAPEGADQGGER